MDNAKSVIRTIRQICPLCMGEHTVTVNRQAYNLWRAGELIQIAMPNLSATEREQLISGMCPDCQKAIFGE